MKRRRFLESVEKDPHEVKICWKGQNTGTKKNFHQNIDRIVSAELPIFAGAYLTATIVVITSRSFVEGDIDRVLHLLIFALICMNSMFGAYSIEQIVDIFNYRCILDANPSFTLQNVIYNGTNTTDPDETSSNSSSLPSDQNNNVSDPQALLYSLFKFGESEDRDEGKKVPNTDDYYVLNHEIYFVNETYRGRVTMRMMHTVFSEPMMCNIAIFIPLGSLTISSALMVFILFCGRGGRALSTDPFPGSWLYVYPVLIISFLMFILYCIAWKMVGLGFHSFCGHFEKYTGHAGCSRFMNYFTKQQLAGFRKFWQNMVYCEIAYPLGAVLWALQLLLTFLRILNMADFNLRMVVIAPKKSNWSEEDEEIELESYPAGTPKLYDIMKVAVEARDKGKVKAV